MGARQKQLPIDGSRLINALGEKGETLVSASIELGYGKSYLSQQSSAGMTAVRNVILLEKVFGISYDEIRPVAKETEQKQDTSVNGEGLSYKKVSIAVYKANRKIYDDIRPELEAVINRAVYSAIRGVIKEMGLLDENTKR